MEDAKRHWGEQVEGTVRGNPYSFGELSLSPAERLYAVIRHLRPAIVVETGVCNGISTTVVLHALDRNAHGRLYSIDLPEFSDGALSGELWEGKKGAVIPAGYQPGWVVPTELRDRWELIVGPSQERLPPLLDRLGPIDMFIHDGEHSYECMRFEFEQAAKFLRTGGVLVADDSYWTPAFDEFVAAHGVDAIELDGGMRACRMG